MSVKAVTFVKSPKKSGRIVKLTYEAFGRPVPELELMCDLLRSEPYQGAGGGEFDVECLQVRSKAFSQSSTWTWSLGHRSRLYCYKLFPQNRLVTTFSALNYDGNINDVAIMTVNSALMNALFKIIRSTG